MAVNLESRYMIRQKTLINGHDSFLLSFCIVAIENNKKNQQKLPTNILIKETNKWIKLQMDQRKVCRAGKRNKRFHFYRYAFYV